MYETDTDLDTARSTQREQGGRFKPYTKVRFRERLSTAAQDGIIWGVKAALAFGLILLTASYLLGDYSQVRVRALKGEQAFTFIQQQIEAQQKQAKAQPPTPVKP